MAVSLDLLALTADYPVEHPLRQAAARLTTRLSLAEGKIATALEALTVSRKVDLRKVVEILRR